MSACLGASSPSGSDAHDAAACLVMLASPDAPPVKGFEPNENVRLPRPHASHQPSVKGVGSMLHSLIGRKGRAQKAAAARLARGAANSQAYPTHHAPPAPTPGGSMSSDDDNPMPPPPPPSAHESGAERKRRASETVQRKPVTWQMPVSWPSNTSMSAAQASNYEASKPPYPVTSGASVSGASTAPVTWHSQDLLELLSSASVILSAWGVSHTLQSKLDLLADGEVSSALDDIIKAVLRDECCQARPLDHERCMRLCKLLDLPKEVCAGWEQRIQELKRNLTPPSRSVCVSSAAADGAGCVAAVSHAYNAALVAECANGGMKRGVASSRTFVQCFGRQTTWCTVTLLRAVLHHPEWMQCEAGRELAANEAALASQAVSSISSISS